MMWADTIVIEGRVYEAPAEETAEEEQPKAEKPKSIFTFAPKKSAG